MAAKSDFTKSRSLRRAVSMGSVSLRWLLGFNMRRSRSREDLAGIEDSLRIERALKIPHHRKFDRVRAPRKFRRLEPSDSMFGADAAAEIADQIEDGLLKPAAALQECCFVGAPAPCLPR